MHTFKPNTTKRSQLKAKLKTLKIENLIEVAEGFNLGTQKFQILLFTMAMTELESRLDADTFKKFEDKLEKEIMEA